MSLLTFIKTTKNVLFSSCYKVVIIIQHYRNKRDIN